MKIAGAVLLIIGIIGLVLFGIQAFNDSETFSLFGMDVAVSKADWTPVIASAVITILGAIFIALGKNK